MDKAKVFYAKDLKSWHEWLAKHHATEHGVWLEYDKGTGRTMSWSDIVDEALCFGWIDSRPAKVSATRSRIYICRRKPKSVWSRINKEKVELLQQQSRMQAAGLEAVKTAKMNGSWHSLDLSDKLVIPAELKDLFAKNPVARQHFMSFSDSSKRIILQWIYSAKRPETKMERIKKTADEAAENKKAYPL